MRRRDLAALLALVGGLAWFFGPGDRASAALRDAHAREVGTVRLHELVQGVVVTAASTPEALPSGATAARVAGLLTEAVHDRKMQDHWVQVALSALDPEQVDAISRAPLLPGLPRSHAHPTIPPDLLRIADLLGQQYGSVPASEVAEVDRHGWPAGSETLTRGLRAILESGDPPLKPEQAAAVLAAVLAGMKAHVREPELVTEAATLLGPDVAVQDSVQRDDDVLRQYAPLAIEVLERRALQ